MDFYQHALHQRCHGETCGEISQLEYHHYIISSLGLLKVITFMRVTKWQ